jgi:hypothetical protein
MILDIHNLSRKVADLEVARPRALLAWLFGWGPQRNEPSWFEALKCWSEIGDIVAESEGWGESYFLYLRNPSLVLRLTAHPEQMEQKEQ